MKTSRNILEEHKLKSRLSYKRIGKYTGLDHTTVFRAVTDPGRVSLETLLIVAEAVGLRKNNAISLWKDARDHKLMDRVERKRAQELRKASREME